MHLTICVGCGHPANEHGEYGCLDLWDDDPSEHPEVCGCQRTETEVYRQHVPLVGEHAPATEARAGDREPSA